MDDPILEEITSSLAPMVRALVAQYAPKITEHPTFQAIAEVVKTLADRDGLTVGTFISSGRAIEVMRALTAGEPSPEKPDIQIIRCPSCQHVMYN